MEHFKDELDEELYVYEINRARRQLTTFQQVELVLKEKPIRAKIAEQNMKAGKTLSRNQERVHVDEVLAKSAGVSKDTLNKVEKVLQAVQENPNRKLSVDYESRIEHSAYPSYTKVLEDAQRGELKISQAFAIINRDSEN